MGSHPNLSNAIINTSAKLPVYGMKAFLAAQWSGDPFLAAAVSEAVDIGRNLVIQTAKNAELNSNLGKKVHQASKTAMSRVKDAGINLIQKQQAPQFISASEGIGDIGAKVKNFGNTQLEKAMQSKNFWNIFSVMYHNPTLSYYDDGPHMESYLRQHYPNLWVANGMLFPIYVGLAQDLVKAYRDQPEMLKQTNPRTFAAVNSVAQKLNQIGTAGSKMVQNVRQRAQNTVNGISTRLSRMRQNFRLPSQQPGTLLPA